MKLTLKPKTPEYAPKKHPRVDRGERRFDTTQLKESGYAHQVHRDYAAHYFRWGFVKNFVKNGMSVLEVGCGQDMPLPRVLNGSLSNVPGQYVGVDMNKLPRALEWNWIDTREQFDFTTRYKEIIKEFGLFDVVVCYEVIEHMSKEDGGRLLDGIRACMKAEGVALISTPVYNQKHMAANHIHEYEFKELREHFENHMLVVSGVYGTFMTSQAIKRVCTPQEKELIEKLHEFYSWDVLANFLAPKYPEAASNCCWVLKTDEPPF